MIKHIFALLLLAALINTGYAQQEANNIRLNQVGFYPNTAKTAIVYTDKEADFTIKAPDGTTAFSGKLKKALKPDLEGKTTWIADFTSLTQPGTYTLMVDGAGRSYPFVIQADAYQKLAKASIKAFYFQRASTPLPEKYAGIWHRNEGHPDTAVLVHPSAAGKTRPAGSLISSPRGWYDAGDYNKYIVNSGITMGTLLSLYEDFPAQMKSVQLDIPETGNQLPDVLNEVLWNLRWMFTMQDPDDGGVYHKLTNADFDGMLMPDKCVSPRYVVQKSTAAALEFAAVMAQSARIFKNFGSVCPHLSDSCLTAATKAWQWAMTNRQVAYDQDEINRKFEPRITTGTYGSFSFGEEFFWAACELYVTTKDENYFKITRLIHDNSIGVPSWGKVKLLGYYSLIRNKKDVDGIAESDLPGMTSQLLNFADAMLERAGGSAYGTVMGSSATDFNWGSNSFAANEGILLIQAYLITQKAKYLAGAITNLDYLLGRNGTGYCYVTGFGTKNPKHPHHRLSVADGITEPVPGLLVGGPNPGVQDGQKYPSAVADQAYLDDDKAYASNEIAINWNAPLAYLVNTIEILRTGYKPN
ncbi:endoglucanase [Mucilaginibacter oryzae]|uniref:Endoglucanase n=1 Tax=Mucilaginibacter oryzae TaxID=468058 RepID=A0A316H9Q1_9SPHI|nr:glycoside hydrolase family 9 protein [Mucilaginibacter oryzae]PWK77207.1 endoglucanase [Mucilaginibacter oryzae]